MVAVLFSWLIISFVCISFGNSSIKICNAIITDTSSTYDVFDRFFIGLSFTSALACLWSLFFPLNLFSLAFFLLLSSLYWLIHWNESKRIAVEFVRALSREKKLLLPFVLIILSVIVFSLTRPISYDTPLYHIQSILWNEKFAAIPGLANLHDRLGFNSSLMVLSSVFSFDFLFHQPIFGVNSLCILFFTLWLACISIRRPGIQCIIALAVYYFFFSYYADNISSPSTDLAPNLLCLYLLLKLLLQERAIEKSPMVYIALPIFCLTLKLSVFPIALLTCLALYRVQPVLNIKKIIFLGAVATIILIPWVVRNAILTGYVFFPFPEIDLLKVDWKVPRSVVSSVRNWVYSWARIPGLGEIEVLKMNVFEWFPKWWPGPSLPGTLFLLSVSSPVILLWIKLNRLELLHRKDANALNTKIASVNYSDLTSFWLIAYLGFIAWFITAPAFRFSFSFLLALSVLPLLFLDMRISERYFKVPGYLALILISLFFIKKGYYSLDELISKPAVISWLSKPGYKPSTGIEFTSHQVGSTTFYVPAHGDQSFDKFPSMPFFLEDIKMRGTSIQDGFKIDNSIQDSTGTYRTEDGIVYKNDDIIDDLDYKNPIVKLHVNSEGYAEFVNKTGLFWNSRYNWGVIVKDNTGTYQLFDGVIYKDGGKLYEHEIEKAVKLYLNAEGNAEFLISTGGLWNSKHAWIN